MAKSSPSLIALLGLAAVAGYQNRGKLSEMLGNNQNAGAGGMGGSQGGGGLMGQLAGMLGGGGSASGGAGGLGGGAGGFGGANPMGGLGELMERFRGAGRGSAADSWVSSGQNEAIHERDLEQALDHETLEELSQKTGLSRSELLQRLSAALPETVDHLTPHGRIS